jgi:uncharacterized membrane protein
MPSTDNQNGNADQTAQMENRRGIELQPQQEQQQQQWQQYRDDLAHHFPETSANVGPDERAVSVAAGAILGLLGLSRRSLPGLAIAGLGSMLLYRGVTGQCGLYEKLGLDTAKPDPENPESFPHGIQITSAILINKPAAEIYRFWRDFQNLPTFMEHLEAVTLTDDRRSHWIAKAPSLFGGKVQWDAEITEDLPDQRIAWRSLPGSTIATAGEVRFLPALGDRGTEVHVWMNYTPPGGTLGHWVTSLLGQNPKRFVREALHNLQRIMEIGHLPTIIGQPHGTCTGRGKEYSESSWKPQFTT